MKSPSQKSVVNENRAHKARENMDQGVNENRPKEANGKYEESVPNKCDEILIESNSVNTKHIEYPLPTQENPHIIHECCAQKQSRLHKRICHDVPL